MQQPSKEGEGKGLAGQQGDCVVHEEHQQGQGSCVPHPYAANMKELEFVVSINAVKCSIDVVFMLYKM